MTTPTTFAGPSAAAAAEAAWDPTQATTSGSETADHWWRPDQETYEDDALTTAAEDDGDVVGSWDDVLAGDEVTQSTTANKPTLKLNIQNGMPVLRFDGNDYLQGPFTNGGQLTQPITVFVIAQLDAGSVDDGNSHRPLDSDDNTNRILLGQRAQAGADTWSVYFGTFLDDGASDSNWNIWTVVANGASSAIYINGGSAGGTGDAGTDAADGITMGGDYAGAGNFWTGDIGDILIFDNAALSAADLNEVGQYFADRWNITWSAIS